MNWTLSTDPEDAESGEDKLHFRAHICLLPNVSRHDITREYWDTRAPAVAVFMSAFFVVALSWNSFILYCMLTARTKLLRAPTRVVLFSLAANDLLLALLVMPVSIITTIVGESPFGGSDYIRCKVCRHGGILTVLSVSSIHHIALLSLDRFLYVRMPISYEIKVTRCRMLLAVLGVWLVSVTMGVLPLFGVGAIGYSSSIGTCLAIFHGKTHLTENMNYILLFFVEALLPITMIVVCNSGLLYTARKHLKFQAARRQRFSRDDLKVQSEREAETKVKGEQKKQQIQLLKVFGAIFIGNMITWMPILGLALSAQVIDFENVPPEGIAFVYVSYISYALIHPILESFFILDTRTKVKRKLYLLYNTTFFQKFCLVANRIRKTVKTLCSYQASFFRVGSNAAT